MSDRLIVPTCCCAEQDSEIVMSPDELFIKVSEVAGAYTSDERDLVDSLNASVGGLLSVRGAGNAESHMRLRILTAVAKDDAPAVLQHVAVGADRRLMGEALRLAAHQGAVSIVRELIAVGLSVNDACPQTGITPLQLAAMQGHHTAVELLVDAQADVHVTIGGSTALTLAHRTGNAEVVEIIARHMKSLEVGDQPADGNGARAHIVPRVSPIMSEAVLQALPVLPDSTHRRLVEGKSYAAGPKGPSTCRTSRPPGAAVGAPDGATELSNGGTPFGGA